MHELAVGPEAVPARRVRPLARPLPVGEGRRVDDVVAPDKLMERTMEEARELANGPQVAMRLLKRSIYNAAELTWSQSLDEIAAKTSISDHHPDAREGMLAFREKRAAQFNKQLDERG